MRRRARPEASLCLALLLAACAATNPPAERPTTVASAPSQPEDPSVDWHGLMVMPMGGMLQDSPRPLHEVLLFRETAAAAGSDGADCYGVDGPAPRLLGRVPREYLLCFAHDRLVRIQATVVLPDAVERTFAHACARWLRSATPRAATDTECAGRDGMVSFSARLEPSGTRPDAGAELELTLAAEPGDDATYPP